MYIYSRTPANINKLLQVGYHRFEVQNEISLRRNFRSHRRMRGGKHWKKSNSTANFRERNKSSVSCSRPIESAGFVFFLFFFSFLLRREAKKRKKKEKKARFLASSATHVACEAEMHLARINNIETNSECSAV